MITFHHFPYMRPAIRILHTIPSDSSWLCQIEGFDEYLRQIDDV